MDELRTTISAWLDPQLIGEILIAWGGRVLGAVAIFVIGRFVVRAVTRAFNHAMQRVGLDQTLNRFFGNLIYMVLLVFVILTAITTLGGETHIP
jgi:small conductance mechanosensitive channel